MNLAWVRVNTIQLVEEFIEVIIVEVTRSCHCMESGGDRAEHPSGFREGVVVTILRTAYVAARDRPQISWKCSLHFRSSLLKSCRVGSAFAWGHPRPDSLG